MNTDIIPEFNIFITDGLSFVQHTIEVASSSIRVLISGDIEVQCRPDVFKAAQMGNNICDLNQTDIKF